MVVFDSVPNSIGSGFCYVLGLGYSPDSMLLPLYRPLT